MPDPSTPAVFDVAILGNGAAGTLLALHLARAPGRALRVALVGTGEAGHGVAYSTPFAEHVLNVPAAGMSAFDGEAADFARFVESVGGLDAVNAPFAPRQLYGDYLGTRLAESFGASPHQLQHVPARAIGVDRRGDAITIALDDGTAIAARHVVLALGNQARRLPFDAPVLDSWDWAAIRALPADADVLVVGSGLSMADAVLSLDARGHRGIIHVLSRHGRMPLPHALGHAPWPVDIDALCALPLRARLHALRDIAREAARTGAPWQSVLDGVRPHVRRLWRSLTPADQARFLRHGVRLWDIHRHRIAPHVHGMLGELQSTGRLHVHRARLQALTARGDRLHASATRGSGPLELDVDAVIDATGVETGASAMGQPLVDALLASGRARPGPHGLGLDGDADGRVLGAHGSAHPDLWMLGGLRLGTLWETTAIPDLRKDAAALAARLAGD